MAPHSQDVPLHAGGQSDQPDPSRIVLLRSRNLSTSRRHTLTLPNHTQCTLPSLSYNIRHPYPALLSSCLLSATEPADACSCWRAPCPNLASSDVLEWQTQVSTKSPPALSHLVHLHSRQAPCQPNNNSCLHTTTPTMCHQQAPPSTPWLPCLYFTSFGLLLSSSLLPSHRLSRLPDRPLSLLVLTACLLLSLNPCHS